MSLANITSKHRGKLIIKAYKNSLKKNHKVIDIGCGNGVITTQLKDFFKFKVIGCDIINYLLTDIPFRKMTKDSQIPFRNKSFDISMFNDVLHHMPKEVQIKMLKEALRVSKKVLIFEVQPTISGTIFDFILNKIHNFNMYIPFTFRKTEDWAKVFENLNCNYKVITVDRPTFYPFSHVAFVLTKTKD
ncbi:MAG TPA: class I SAM-dependent methyltransferase [Patescibacteria group bacterium]